MNTIIILLAILILLSIPMFFYPRKITPPINIPVSTPINIHVSTPITKPVITSKDTFIKPYLDPEDGCEVYPNIYLGNSKFASDKQLLYNLKVTHILNAAKEIPDYFQGDDTFQYIHLNLDDVPQENASRFFEISKQFIDKAVENNGVVLIHCRAGVSRSVTMLMYYLMKTLNISPEDALKIIRKCRPIANPNSGFLRQLRYT